MKKIFFVISCAAILVACVTQKPYKISEVAYNATVKNLSETIAKKEVKVLPEVQVTTITIDSVFTKTLFVVKDSISKTKGRTINGKETEWISTVNFNLRKANFIILHHTAQDSVQQTIKTFTLDRTKVSAHYVIAEDGRVIQMLNDYLRAWHAGIGSWGKNTDINSVSIGIELDNNGSEPFSDAQIASLVALLSRLQKEYNIPAQNIIGHADIAPARKKDPSAFFPWKTLALNGFGLWPDEVLEPAPADFNIELGLRIIGYSTVDLPAAITAFKLHYMQTEVNAVVDEKTRNTIYNIFKKS